jgi:DNA-binding IclR family transcriptional regulator
MTLYQAPTVKKAFSILQSIAKSDHGMGISQLAQSLQMSKGTIHGVIGALETVGAVNRDPATKRYTLGLTLFELGKKAYVRIDLKDAARPVLKSLMEKCEESVFLGISNGGHVTIIDTIEPAHDLKITASAGMTIPLLAGATGKVLLAAAGMKKAAKMVQSNGLPKFTDRSITDPATYLKAVEAVIHNGYGVDDEEYLTGVRATAAAIMRQDHASAAAIWVVGFKSEINRTKLKKMAIETRQAAETISRRLFAPRQ